MRMISDNNIIITSLKRTSEKIAVNFDEPAVLLRCTGIKNKYEGKVRVVRGDAKGRMSFTEISISSAYQKIKVWPYEWVQFEIKNWDLVLSDTEIHFKVIKGTHNELLFYDLRETIDNYNAAFDIKTYTFILGHHEGSFIRVFTPNMSYFICEVVINNQEYRAASRIFTPENMSLYSILTDIQKKIKSKGEDPAKAPNVDKSKNFEATLNKHLKPVIY
jgi:hypothetical protein